MQNIRTEANRMLRHFNGDMLRQHLRQRREVFDKVDFDADRYRMLMNRPFPDNRYLFLFTPRSGSSRVTDLLDETGLVCPPREQFNPAFMADIAAKLSARHIGEYLPLLQRRFNLNGTFGVQMTFSHVVNSFFTGRSAVRALKPQKYIWLFREDIVAQAVSVSRMVQTKVAHSVHTTKQNLEGADDRFEYDEPQIHHALLRILWMENRSEKLLARKGHDVLRMSYEFSTKIPATALVQKLLGHIDIPCSEGPSLLDNHVKLPGEKGRIFSERFRATKPELISHITALRARRLRRLEWSKDHW